MGSRAGQRGDSRSPSWVPQMQADTKAIAGAERLEFLVVDSLTFEGQPISFNVGIAISVDAVLGLGFSSGLEPWMIRIEGGRRYVFRKL